MALLPLIYSVVLLVGLYILSKSASFLITATLRLGHILRLSQFVTGFIILGVTTSTPEISIAVSSLLSGTPQLSLGNLMGANIVLLTLIAGIAAIIGRGVTIKHELKSTAQIAQIALLILAPLILLLDQHLSRLDAIFLAVLYIAYLTHLYHLRPQAQPPSDFTTNHHFFHTLFLIVMGLLGIILSSKAIVASSLYLSQTLGIAPSAIGVLLLSLGTNLPEISVILAAVRQHQADLIIGDVLGSAAANTAIIALLGLFSPFRLENFLTIQTTGIFLVLSLIAFIIMTRTKNRLSPMEGAVCLGLYIAFLISESFLLYLKP